MLLQLHELAKSMLLLIHVSLISLQSDAYLMLLERNGVDGRFSQTVADCASTPVCTEHQSMSLVHAVQSGEMIVSPLKAASEDREIQVCVALLCTVIQLWVCSTSTETVLWCFGCFVPSLLTATGGCLSGVCRRSHTDVSKGHYNIEGSSRLENTCLSVTTLLILSAEKGPGLQRNSRSTH